MKRKIVRFAVAFVANLYYLCIIHLIAWIVRCVGTLEVSSPHKWLIEDSTSAAVLRVVYVAIFVFGTLGRYKKFQKYHPKMHEKLYG